MSGDKRELPYARGDGSMREAIRPSKPAEQAKRHGRAPAGAVRGVPSE